MKQTINQSPGESTNQSGGINNQSINQSGEIKQSINQSGGIKQSIN